MNACDNLHFEIRERLIGDIVTRTAYNIYNHDERNHHGKPLLYNCTLFGRQSVNVHASHMNELT